MSRTTDKSSYRSIDRLSYSALASYAINRGDFFMQYILKDEEYLKKRSEDAEENQSLKMGNLLDCLRTDESNFDKLYHISNEVPAPSGQELTLCNLLYKEVKKNPGDFERSFINAYETLKEKNGGKLRDKLETKLEKFTKEDKDGVIPELYFQELIKAGDKTTITAKEYEIVQKQLDKIKKNPEFNHKRDTLTKKIILFDYNGVDLKCEIDKVEIDEKKKILYLIDYKTSFDVENFIYVSFLKRMYFIQSSLYKYALQQWALDNMPGYKVENMEFRVFDVTGKNLDPLIYRTNDKWFNKGFEGFMIRGRKYRGINQILEEIEISKRIDNWGISVENYKNKGVIWIPDFEYE